MINRNLIYHIHSFSWKGNFYLMKPIYFAVVIVAIFTALPIYAYAEEPVQSLPLPAQPSSAPIEGTAAGGETQMTVIDADGNLKMVDPSSPQQQQALPSSGKPDMPIDSSPRPMQGSMPDENQAAFSSPSDAEMNRPPMTQTMPPSTTPSSSPNTQIAQPGEVKIETPPPPLPPVLTNTQQTKSPLPGNQTNDSTTVRGIKKQN